MPYDEYLKWVTFFSKRPIGWREDRRTAMLMRAQGVKASEEEIFPSLRLMRAAEEKEQVPDMAVPKGHILALMSRARNDNLALDPKSGKIKADD